MKRQVNPIRLTGDEKGLTEKSKRHRKKENQQPRFDLESFFVELKSAILVPILANACTVFVKKI